MKRVIWKEGKYFSLKLRDESYVLAQMSVDPYITFFNIFKKEDAWEDVELTEDNILFCVPTIRQFLKSNIKRANVREVKEIPAPRVFPPPSMWLNPVGDKEFRIWEGTPFERHFPFHSGYRLVEKDMYCRKNNKIDGLFLRIIEDYYPVDPSQNYDELLKKIEKYEPTFLCGYPSLNERLCLCNLFSKNVNPILEMEFAPQNLPTEYWDFFMLLSGNGMYQEDVDEVLERLGYA